MLIELKLKPIESMYGTFTYMYPLGNGIISTSNLYKITMFSRTLIFLDLLAHCLGKVQ